MLFISRWGRKHDLHYLSLLAFSPTRPVRPVSTILHQNIGEASMLGNLGIFDDNSSARKLRSSDSFVLVTAQAQKTTHQEDNLTQGDRPKAKRAGQHDLKSSLLCHVCDSG